MLQKLTSRKFLLAIANALFIILNEGLELGIPVQAYGWITGAIISYILAEGARDVVLAHRTGK